ncbi:MerR family transcriptional regulator [Streptomyces sp. SPB074]|uniref:MerR family transcriptional regulator n=1 Tax=Streptomyces sp. (strain SPB074) TaxID=465543 RepID=UPI00017FEC9D|nr:MerR family transcriptional regulator [Streptomyces sp. SPB074]EDY45019.1 MerR family transcriptional regulator [Streptomyces sp. SPB074]
MRSSGDSRVGGVPGRRPNGEAPLPLRGGAPGPHPVVPAPAVGYRGPTACVAAGITYRQLDYWARTGLVEPSVRAAQGSGTQRLYSLHDIVVLKIVRRFLDTGVALQNIRGTVGHLRHRDPGDLEGMTLMSDGATVYECTSSEEVVELLQGGQGIFGIAVGVVQRDVEASLAQLHGERVDEGETLVRGSEAAGDELAARRRNRAV